MEVLGKLKPAFKKDGIVTAGNSSAINDGAAALVIMSEDKAKELGITPMATWVAGALGGVDPSIMGVGPIAATRKVMAKTGLTDRRYGPDRGQRGFRCPEPGCCPLTWSST